jgi:hypothetical protein
VAIFAPSTDGERVLEECDPEPVVSRSGLFQDLSLPLDERIQMRDLIGERSELTAYDEVFALEWSSLLTFRTCGRQGCRRS